LFAGPRAGDRGDDPRVREQPGEHA
jgi:hypothetical protein